MLCVTHVYMCTIQHHTLKGREVTMMPFPNSRTCRTVLNVDAVDLDQSTERGG